MWIKSLHYIDHYLYFCIGKGQKWAQSFPKPSPFIHLEPQLFMLPSKSVDTKLIYKQLLAEKKTTAYALEKAANLGNKTVASAMRRNTAISYETAIKINALYPDVSIDWLRTGQGEMLVPVKKQSNLRTANGAPLDFVRQVPFDAFMEAHVLVREARAGYLSAHGDDVYVETLPTMLVPREYEKGNYLVIETVGESMDDGSHRAICDGDKLLVKEIQENRWNDKLPIHRNLYIISTLSEAPVVKQIIEIDEAKKMILCHSWNNQFEDYAVFFEDIDKLFVVKKIVERQIRI